MKLVLKVNGMHCGGCENRIKNVLSSIDEIKEVNANHENGQVEIALDKRIETNIIKEKIENLGFEVESEEKSE